MAIIVDDNDHFNPLGLITLGLFFLFYLLLLPLPIPLTRLLAFSPLLPSSHHKHSLRSDDVIQELIQHEIQDETDNRKNHSEIGEEEEGDASSIIVGKSGSKRHTSDGWEDGRNEENDDLHIELDDLTLEDDSVVRPLFPGRASPSLPPRPSFLLCFPSAPFSLLLPFIQ